MSYIINKPKFALLLSGDNGDTIGGGRRWWKHGSIIFVIVVICICAITSHGMGGGWVGWDAITIDVTNNV